MEKLKLKHESLQKALNRLLQTIDGAEKFKQEGDEEIWRVWRDSMIQRFEFSIELFWKYLKKYLEKEKIKSLSPKSVIRDYCSSGFLDTQDAETFLTMLDDRNDVSHMYKEELADRLSVKIPTYYELMKKYADKLAPNNG